jgi:hypothetical protein
MHLESMGERRRFLNHPSPIIDVARWLVATSLPIRLTSLVDLIASTGGLAVDICPARNDKKRTKLSAKMGAATLADTAEPIKVFFQIGKSHLKPRIV